MSDAALQAVETYMNNLGRDAHAGKDVPDAVIAAAVAAAAAHLRDHGGSHHDLTVILLAIVAQAVGRGLMVRASSEGGEGFIAGQVVLLGSGLISATARMAGIEAVVGMRVMATPGTEEPVH